MNKEKALENGRANEVQSSLDDGGQKPKTKIFRYKDVVVGSVLGGPFAAAFLFYKNLKATGNAKAAKISALSFALGTPAIVTVLALLTPEDVPRIFFFGTYAAAVAVAASLLKSSLNDKRPDGNNFKTYDSTRAALTVAFFMILYAVFIVGQTWAFLKIDYKNATLGDALSLTFLPDSFDIQSYEDYMKQLENNDAAALSELDAALNTEDSQKIEKAADQVLLTYEENRSILNQVQKLQAIPSFFQKEIDYIAKYNQLRIEQIRQLKAAAKQSDPSLNNPNFSKAVEMKEEIDELLDEYNEYKKELGDD